MCDPRRLDLGTDLRPAEIVALAWRETLVIEEDAEMLEPIHLEVAA